MTRTLHLQIRPDQGKLLSLRKWWDNPNTPEMRPVDPGEIQELIGHSELYYGGSFDANTSTVGQKLYEWLDGGERWLGRAIEEASFDVDVLVIAIDVEERLSHLPWETMHDGRRLLIQSENPKVAIARWKKAPADQRPPVNRPLQILFMASSPERVLPELDFEEEEARILRAGEHAKAEVTVEESGTLLMLKQLVMDHPEGFFDVFHLTGHADHKEDGPRFYLEDETGQPKLASADELVEALPRKPRLIFLSGCRTGQGDSAKEVRSMAEQVMEKGYRSVLGWGKPVGDPYATRAAEVLYEALSRGDDLATAVAESFTTLVKERIPHWHLLRWFQAGDAPGPYVTPLLTPGRISPERRSAVTEFLDPETGKVKVATREEFVGQRRLLQRSIRDLRGPSPPAVGIQLSGFMGRGKSSVAARLCDRLSRNFHRSVVFGTLDETKLLGALLSPLNGPEHQAVKEYAGQPDVELRDRLSYVLEFFRSQGALPRLVVLDDFEQNQKEVATGSNALTPEAARVLTALVEAVRKSGADRVLLTGRYALSSPYSSALSDRRVEPLSESGQLKLLRRLQARPSQVSKDRLSAVQDVAEGNPRLFRTLVSVALEEDIDFDRLLARIGEATIEFRNQSAAAVLVEALRPSARQLLATMAIFEVPVPISVLRALEVSNHSITEEDVRKMTVFALVDEYRGEREPCFLASTVVTDLVPLPDEQDLRAPAERALEAMKAWWPDGFTEEQSFAMAVVVSYGNQLSLVENMVGYWRFKNLHVWTLRLFRRLPAIFDHSPRLLRDLSLAYRNAGMGAEADAALLASKAHDGQDPAQLAIAEMHTVDALLRQGDFDEALRALDILVPTLERLGDDRMVAISHGKIADVLTDRGDYDGALNIRREKQLPVFDRLGDVRSSAVTWSDIADVLMLRGDYDGALKIRREKELPVFVRLGDEREAANTWSRIADVLMLRGDYDGALEIRRDRELPVYDRLGDVRESAVTWGKIADVLMRRGDHDGALEIRREKELPVFDRLGDAGASAVTWGKIADVLMRRGDHDGALEIRREKELPVFDRLGDARSSAVTWGKIADVLMHRGDYDGALEIHRERELPVFDRLGEVRSLIVCRANIAQLLVAINNPERDGKEIVDHLVWAYREAKARVLPEAGQIAEYMRSIGFPDDMIERL
jgi:tetratricopeptide (TPR) repeat protein/CHAT domain-containing protein